MNSLTFTFTSNFNQVFINSIITTLLLTHGFHILPVVNAQNQSALVSPSVIRVLIDDAVQALQNGNSTKTLQNLRVVDQMISEIDKNSSNLQASKLLIGDAIDALNNNNTARAILYLNLTGQQFGMQNFNQTFQLPISANPHFLTYNSPVLGISIQYPRDWSITEYEYNPAANNTLVGFYSPSKTASELGNISGVSGNFVPYLDIFVFGPKNVSLNDVVKERLNTLNKSSNFVINESKFIPLEGNQSAYNIVYSSISQGEHFEKMQVYTSFHDKVYLISFTAQNALFSSYLDTVQKMVNSFRVSNSTTK